MNKQTDKQALKQWELFVRNLQKATNVDVNETEIEKQKRIKKLQNNYEEFFKYYFGNYYKSEPAKFHIKASKRFIETSPIYEVRAWARELAKSARTMMEVMYLVLTGKAKNVLLISHSETNAKNLLKPYQLNFEYNERIINDFGQQKGLFNWEEGSFKTKSGASFLAIGAGQSPRGTRNEDVRPDIIIFDDIDTDEEVRNPDRIQKKWDWIERAVIPTASVSESKRIIFLGNIIGKDTVITRAAKMADFFSKINIRDKNGKSTWPAKNAEEAIDYMLSKISFASGQQEYFNNPITQGAVFKEVTWGRIPKITSFPFLLKYGDPAYSNRTSKQNSHKAVVLMAKHDNIYYIISCRLDKATNSTFVDWYNELQLFYSHPKVQNYNYVENNGLQNPFFEQVLEPEFNKKGVAIRGDDRQKPDKFFRVEGNLEPLLRTGKIIFNEKEKENPHMKRLEEQFLAFSKATAKHLDGPDAVEGAVWLIDTKLNAGFKIYTANKKQSKNRY